MISFCPRTFNKENNPYKTVVDSMTTRIGFSNSEELFSAMNVSFLSSETYIKNHEAVCDVFYNIACEKYTTRSGYVDEKYINPNNHTGR